MAKNIKRAVIKQIAEDHRIPYGAAAHKYDCMSIAKKQALCTAMEKRRKRIGVSLFGDR